MRSSNCNNCKYKENSDGGHCYMFRNKPNGVCGQYKAVEVKPNNYQDANREGQQAWLGKS